MSTESKLDKFARLQRPSRLLITVLAWILVGCLPNAEPLEVEVREPTLTFSPIPTFTRTATSTPSIAPSQSPTATHWLQDTNLPIGKVSYIIPPTILHVTQETASLFFELDKAAAGSLVLRPVSGGRIMEAVLDSQLSRHQLLLEGLEVGVIYEVILAVEDEAGSFVQPSFLSQPWGPVYLKTVSEDEPLRFGMLSDASFGDPVTEQLIMEMAEYDLDFVLNAGDVVDESQAGSDPFQSYAEKYFKPFEPLLSRMPIYTVPGNHDYDLDIRYQDEPFYFYAFPPFDDPRIPSQAQSGKRQFYAFSYGGIQFLMLDSQTFFGVAGRQEQLDWLTERLGDNNFITSIPVFHVSPFSSSVVHPTDSLPVRSSWVPLFEQAGVRLVLSGHFHHYERFSRNEVAYIVAGGGSSILYAQGQLLLGSELYRRQSHFLLIDIEESELTIQAIALGGEVMDALEISLP